MFQSNTVKKNNSNDVVTFKSRYSDSVRGDVSNQMN